MHIAIFHDTTLIIRVLPVLAYDCLSDLLYLSSCMLVRRMATIMNIVRIVHFGMVALGAVSL